MNFKPDIENKIITDFGDNSDRAFEILENSIAQTDYLKTDRIVRCIIFLSKGDLTDLAKFITVAINDPRDVMLWAEYEEHGKLENYRRIRDFNKTFDHCSQNVKE